jgi:hypothetical protein
MSFTTLDITDFVVSAEAVTAPAWSSNIPTLNTFFTSSASSSFYLDVYNTGSNLVNSAIQFTIAYGDLNGSGSAPINSLIATNTPTRITYGQYRNIVYGDAETVFNFGTGNTQARRIFAIPIDRNRYKQSLMPGTFNLTLGSGSSATFISLTDNSLDSTVINYLDCGRVFNIVSGSNGTAKNTPLPLGSTTLGYTVSGSYGLFLPDIGTIILNADALELPYASGGIGLSIDSGTTSISNGVNNSRLFMAIRSGSAFQLLSEETVSSNYVFVRIKNADYNYTTNASLITGSGDFVYSNFINNPQTFPTTVGLYNDNNDLLAVAKMSKPLVKDFTKEALIRVKLSW